MKRSGFKRRSAPMSRSSPKPKESKLTVKSYKPMKHGKVPATADQKRWMACVASYGCVVCRNLGFGKVPCAVHHIIEGGRRVGHYHTIGLCDPGHHQNSPCKDQISRHPNKKRFESSYGTEYELLEQTRKAFADMGLKFDYT